MAAFNYVARTVAGKITRGRLEAKDDTEVKIKLRARQLTPVKIEVESKKKKSDMEVLVTAFFAPKLKSKELQIFTRQFATLINAGIPILDAIKILSEGSINPVLKEALIAIKANLESGRRLSESMAQHPRVFDRLYCNLMQAGEEAGILDTILNRLATYIEKNEKIKGQVRGALIMPTLIMVVAALVISAMLFFIIPKFKEFYTSSGKPLPALTQIVVDLSNGLRNHWFIIFGGLFAAIMSFVYWLKTEEGKTKFDTFMINAPLMGDLVQKASVARMSRTLSTLLSSGVGLIEAIEIAARTSGNQVIEQALIDCKDSVMVGKPLHQPLARKKEIPFMVSQMVAIGEQSGSTDTMLAKIADFYEDEVENAVKAMTSLIEPLMMVFLGGIIAFLMIAMYLPIFNLGDTISI